MALMGADEPEVGIAAIGAASVIIDPDGRVLLVRHAYGRHNWELPGGNAIREESPDITAARELLEETGIRANVGRLTGVYHEPAHRLGPMLHFVFWVEWEASLVPEPCSDEIGELGWFAPDSLPRPISDFTERRILDAIHARSPVVRTVTARRWRDPSPSG